MHTTTVHISTHMNLRHMGNSFRDPEPFEYLHLKIIKKNTNNFWSKLQSLQFCMQNRTDQISDEN